NPEDYAVPANCGINFILMRYPEILLTYAEAKIESDQIDQSVADAINEIRSRPDVNMPDVALGTKEQMREIVRNERVVELAYEGLHFFDIRRWRTAEFLIPGGIEGMTYTAPNDELVTIVEPAWTNSFRAD